MNAFPGQKPGQRYVSKKALNDRSPQPAAKIVAVIKIGAHTSHGPARRTVGKAGAGNCCIKLTIESPGHQLLQINPDNPLLFTILCHGYRGRPPLGSPKRTVFEAQRGDVLLYPQSSQAPSEALFQRPYRGLPAYFIKTSRRTSVDFSQLTTGRSVESPAQKRHASQSLAVLRCAIDSFK